MGNFNFNLIENQKVLISACQRREEIIITRDHTNEIIWDIADYYFFFRIRKISYSISHKFRHQSFRLIKIHKDSKWFRFLLSVYSYSNVRKLIFNLFSMEPWALAKKMFKLVWRCHQLLPGFLPKGHLLQVSRLSYLSANDRIIMRRYRGLCTDLLAFALRLRKTPGNPS